MRHESGSVARRAVLTGPPAAAEAEWWAGVFGRAPNWVRPSAVARSLRWDVIRKPFDFGAPHLRSLLVALGPDGFVISVNITIARTRFEQEWAIAHELGHSLFIGDDGRRAVPWTPAEEEFCDSVADSWIAALGRSFTSLAA